MTAPSLSKDFRYVVQNPQFVVEIFSDERKLAVTGGGLLGIRIVRGVPATDLQDHSPSLSSELAQLPKARSISSLVVS